MKASSKTLPYSLLIWIAALSTIAASPNLNKDALIVPKVSILFIGTLVLLPILFLNYKQIKSTPVLNILGIVIVLMFIQLLISGIVSESPMEQIIFGRTGRGLGFITWISIILICLLSAILVNSDNIKKLIGGLCLSGLFSIIYSIFQSFGLDFFPWDSKTNGVIGTLGNPNFVSSFTAIISLPLLIFFAERIRNRSYKVIFNLFLIIFLILAVFRAESTQGYITLALSFTVFSLVYFWYKNRLIFTGSLIMFLIVLTFGIAGILNHGPLASYLYKISIQSRGEFWSSAFAVANSHPIFGVGMDSFGDYYLKYRSKAVVNEYTDSAHNYFLDFAANVGYLFLFLNVMIILLTLMSFFIYQKNVAKFDARMGSLVAAYVVYLAQSLISPISIPLILWGFIISGSIIGLAVHQNKLEWNLAPVRSSRFKYISTILSIIGIIIIFPFFNADRLQLQAMNNGDGDLAIKVAKMYPESVVRYSVLSRALLDSGLAAPSLDLARSAVKFNPNSPALWALIVINQAAPIEERKAALQTLVKLDPINEELINFKF